MLLRAMETRAAISVQGIGRCARFRLGRPRSAARGQASRRWPGVSRSSPRWMTTKTSPSRSPWCASAAGSMATTTASAGGFQVDAAGDRGSIAIDYPLALRQDMLVDRSSDSGRRRARSSLIDSDQLWDVGTIQACKGAKSPCAGLVCTSASRRSCGLWREVVGLSSSAGRR